METNLVPRCVQRVASLGGVAVTRTGAYVQYALLLGRENVLIPRRQLRTLLWPTLVKASVHAFGEGFRMTR